MRILLFKLGALGDLLMTTPLARQLRRSFPGAKIDYLAGESFTRVLAGNPHIDEIVTFPERIFYRREITGLLRLIRAARVRRYDVIFVLDKHWIFPLTAFLFGIRRRIGFDRMGREGVFLTDKVRYGDVRHEVHYYLDLLGKVGTADTKDVALEFSPSDGDLRFADDFWAGANLDGKRVVCLAPGGGVNPGQELPLKRWPAENWIRLIRPLREKGYEVLLIGGASDRAVEREILAEVAVPSGVGASLGESAALVRKAFAVVCNDSGPMHLAAAVNRRVLSLFGPTDPRRLAPLTGYSFIWKPGPCGPCYDVYGRLCPCGRDHECMKNIAPREVLDAVLGMGDRS